MPDADLVGGGNDCHIAWSAAMQHNQNLGFDAATRRPGLLQTNATTKWAKGAHAMLVKAFVNTQ